MERWLSADAPSGGQLLPRQLRFRNSTAMSFPASEIESLRIHWGAHDEDASVDGAGATPERIDMVPAFMGLLGVNGTLPTVYTEQIAQRELYHKDLAARSFLDVFSNRAVAMFYAAWKKNRLHLQYETDRKNRFAPMVLALAGVGQSALRDRLDPHEGGVDDESLAFFAGALQQRSLSGAQLAQLLARYLKVQVKIEQFCGRWYTLPPEALTAIGSSNGVLGRNALAGERVWQRDLRVRVLLGPLNHARFRRFLPGAPGALALRKLLTLLSGVSLEYEVNLVLQADAVEGIDLRSSRSPLAGRLGWDTYLQTHSHDIDRCDVRYDVQAAVAA